MMKSNTKKATNIDDVMCVRNFVGDLDNLKEVTDQECVPMKVVKRQRACVEVIGRYGSGKTSLIQQCTRTPLDRVNNVVVSHKNLTTTLTFSQAQFITDSEADAYLVVFSLEDHWSFQSAVQVLHYVSMNPRLSHKIGVLVGNRSDLVRRRVITHEKGVTVAELHGFKYVETSTVLDYNINKLLVGLGMQVWMRDSTDDDYITPKQRLKNVVLQYVRKLRGKLGYGCSPCENFACL